MQPFHFGSTDRPLFGVYHSPESSRANPRGALVCHPGFAEYEASHRATRQLATVLARCGCAVLRFDYSATGDSWGRSEDARLDRWREDVLTAVDELVAIGGVRSVALVGLRLGAALALETVAQRDEIRSVVLWDPVVSGRTYLEKLIEAERQRLDGYKRRPREHGGDGLLGYAVPEGLRASLRDLDLTTVTSFGRCKVLLVTSEASPEYESLFQHVADHGVRIDRHDFEGRSPWGVETAGRLVPAEILDTVVGHLA